MRDPLKMLAAAVVLLGAFVFITAEARASEEDTQFWLLSTADVELDEDTAIAVDSTYRWRPDASGGDQQTFRFLMDQKVVDVARIGGGVGVFEADGGLTEVRITQQARLTFGRIEARTRLEERFFDSADQMELRLRQRLRYAQPITAKLEGAISLEWLHLLQPRFNATLNQDEFRPQIGLTYRARNDFAVALNYLAIISPRGSQTDRISHIPQASVSWKF